MQEIKNNNRVIIALLLTVTWIVLIRTAWISDDAYITIKSVLNFVNGYGPTFNIDERVQAYTHPLWFLLISALTLVLHNVFISTFLLSILCSLAVIWFFITRLSIYFWSGIVAASFLVISKAYVDFSTSGLENPLSHLLLLLGIFWGVKAIASRNATDQRVCFLICASLYLSRPDLLVLIGPFVLFCAYETYTSIRKTVLLFLTASLPIVIWTCFSLFYYGFLFPNTAYAKLGTGIPLVERMVQGLIYFVDSVSCDPITLALIAFGLCLGFYARGVNRALAGGVVLYLMYVVSIGGDFMSGRFFTAPLLVSMVIFARTEFSFSTLKVVSIVFGAIGLFSIQATLLSNANYQDGVIKRNGIADERGYYFQGRGLLNITKRDFQTPQWKGATKIRAVEVACGGLGIISMEKGPVTHVIDACALSDPLLSRLPAVYNANWRIGHFDRQLPTEYEASILRNTNLLIEPVTKHYYEAIRHVTRGPLFEAERFRDIMRLNLNQIQKPDEHLYRYQLIPRSLKTADDD